MPSVVINNSTQLAEALDPKAADAGLQSGSHSAMMIDPQGNPAVIPYEGIGQAIATGFTQPTQQHFENALKFTKFSQPLEQLKTLAEGTAASATFGASTGVETALGVSPEDIRARRQVNPGMHAIGSVAGLAGSALAGVGEGALLEKAGAGVAAGLGGGLKGAAAKGAAEFALMQEGDELSKMLTHDPESTAGNVAANIGYAALFGSVFGSGGDLIKSGLNKTGLEIGKFSERLKSNLTPKEAISPTLESISEIATKPSGLVDQFGKAAKSESEELTQAVEKAVNKKLSPGEKLADALYKAGQEKGLAGAASSTASSAIGAGLGKLSGLPFGATTGLVLGNKAIKPFLDSVIPSLIKPLMDNAANPGAFRQAVQYSLNAVKGEVMAQNAVKEILGSGSKILSKSLIPTPQSLQKLDAIVTHVNSHPQQIANSNSEISHYMPNHAVSLAASLGRVASYLGTLRPDTSKPGILDPDRQPSDVETSAYHRQLAIVEQPLMILKHMKDGTLNHSDIGTMQQVYPDYYNNLKTKVTGALADHLSDGHRVPYHQALNLSLFLGQPLDSSMQPMHMVANQAVHEPKQMPEPQGSASKGTKTDFKSVRLDSSSGQAREASKLMRK